MKKKFILMLTLLAGVLSANADNVVTIGDADGDGSVDVNDVTSTINHILNKPVASFYEKAADVDGDGVIDVNDVQGIIDIALGKAIGPTAKYKYYVGRQPVEGGIGTTDYMNTNTAAFLSSGIGISANSINDIKAAINGSVNVGSIADGDAILILPTEVANSITAIKNTLGYDLIYDKLTAVDGYTCVFIGPYTLDTVNIAF